MAQVTTILPDPTQLHLRELSAAETGIIAFVETTARSTPCPICGAPSERMHSRYVRTVTDVPWHGIAFRLRVHVRRLVCERADCPAPSIPNGCPVSSVPPRERRPAWPRRSSSWDVCSAARLVGACSRNWA